MADLLAVDDDRADQLVVLEHRHGDSGCARRRSLACTGGRGSASAAYVGDVGHLPGAADAAEQACPGPAETVRARVAATRPMRAGCRAGGPVEALAVAEKQDAELGLADADAFSSMAWNTGSSSPGELRDDLQHLGGRGLLLAATLAQLVEQAGVLDGDDGLLGEIARPARSAFR